MTIKGISIRNLAIAAIPSFIILLITFFFNDFYEAISGTILPKSTIAVKSLWFYPIAVYILFAFFFFICYTTVSKKLENNNSSKKEILNVIEQWSGIVDGIGTALPLLGAAVLLFTVGLGTSYQDLFLSFAVPFEIKSLLILATAKLFESIFDEFEMQVQKELGSDEVKTAETDLPKDVKIEFVNYNYEALNEINSTIASWKETVADMKDPEFKDALIKIMKITGKS